MGTSQSSNGSPSGTPMVPPWVPDIPLPDRPEGGEGEGPADSDDTGNDENSDASNENNTSESQSENQGVPIAPPSRFGGARRSMGDYVRSGDKSGMQKGLGQYIKKGYGGSSTATRRMASTASTAQSLFSALSSEAQNPQMADGGALDPAQLSGKTAYEIMDIIVEAVSPIDGTQDTEASRDSIKDALSDVLSYFPDANLNDLSDGQKEFAIERFVAGDVFRRIDLDLGKNIRDKASSTSAALGRLKEIREYVRETVSSAFRSLRALGQILTNQTATQVVQNAIRETCQVFEGYAE